MTLERLANPVAVHDLVGRRPSRRWKRAIPVIRRSDGVSIAGWFGAHDEQSRVRLVRERILNRSAWSPLLRVSIPKRAGRGRRQIDMPTVLDMSLLYLLNDWLQTYAEAFLTRAAAAFRPGRSFSDTILGVHGRLDRLPFAAVIDIETFFDAVSWRLLDGVIDVLPATDAVKECVRGLVRAEVLDRRTRQPILRASGIPQGLPVSPVLANLVLAEFDRHVTRVLGKHGSVMIRYCDDILVLASTMASLERGVIVVHDRLAALGLRAKETTGTKMDTRRDPVTWLGLSLSPATIEVPPAVVAAKVDELQARIDAGVLDGDALEDSLEHRERHYRRILGQDATDRAMASMREGLHLESLPSTTTGKEGIERLHYLVTDR